MQLSFIEQIERGQDLEQIIRQNQLLRVANKQIGQLIRYLIDKVCKKLQLASPDFASSIDLRDITQATVDLVAAIDQKISLSIQGVQSNFQSSLQEQRNINLGLQQKTKDYQKTISEMSLIIQRIQLQLQDKEQENDELKLALAKLKLDLSASEQLHLRWQSRYEIIRIQMESNRRCEEIDLLEQNRVHSEAKFNQ